MELMISIVPFGTFASFFCYLFAIYLLPYRYSFATLLLSVAGVGEGLELISFLD